MCLARILVVDDDDDTRQLLAYALGKSYEVVQAADAPAALAQLRKGAFDLVITDYDMPRQTGADLLNAAGAEGVLGDAATLVVTAHPHPEGVPDEVPLLRKPLDLEKLLVQVRTILPSRPETPAAPPRASKPGAAIDLVLYVSPRSAASDRARRRMQEVLADCGTEGIHYEVCDLFKNADSAERDRVVFTPTLVKRAPSPRVWIVGDLSEDGLVRDLLAMCGARRRSS
jgi:two-component system chemotaxis response regulator CheY